MSEDKRFLRSKLKTVTETLGKCFSRDEGIILGEASVISRKVHLEPRESEGTIHVLSDRDAGMTYLKLIEKDQAIHIDVFHHPAEINIIDLANRLRMAVSSYLDLIYEDDEEFRDEREMLMLNLTQRIYLLTSAGEGTVLNPVRNAGPPGGKLKSHVHILAKITAKHLGLIYYIVEQAEKSVTYQGCRLRPITRVVNVREMELAENFPLGVPAVHSAAETPLEVKLQNMSQAVMALARELGGLEIAEAFVELISPLRAVSLARFGKRYPCMDRLLQDLTTLDYVRKDRLGHSLTKSGRELKEFMQQHRKELGIQIRKAIRTIPPTPGITPSGHFSKIRSRYRVVFDNRKTTEQDRDNWYNPIAVADSVIKAAKRNFLLGSKFNIAETDLMVYRKRYKAPVDICMVVDCSGSMKGAKLQAVRWVAEYLLLTTRDRVAMVTFQEREARVTAPFTRSYQKFHHSLLELDPEGLTPLAAGLMSGLELIRKSRPRNPLLALITDGKPNTPLYSTDPVADALKVCKDFPTNKIRFVIIGIDPAREFIPQLAEAGGGIYYLVDDIDRSNLITIMRSERKMTGSLRP